MEARHIKRRSKYNAERTTVDGLTFDSKLEARRYSELTLFAKCREIRRLKLQPKYELRALGGELIGIYRADFRYEQKIGTEWHLRVEDCKGVSTALYKWKKRHTEAQYGIKIVEIRRAR